MVRMKGEPEANIFVASPAEAAKGAESAAADGVTGSQLYGVCLEGIAALHYVLLGQEYEPDGIDLSILGSHKEVFAYTEMHGGWLYQFPNEPVSILAATEVSQRRGIAERWSSVFENDGHPPTLDEVDSVLEQIIVLARASERDGKPLYWRQDSC